MTTRRVGVLSDNSSLVVALSLQASDLDIVRIGTTDELADRDVALLDLREDQDPEGAVSTLPPGRVVVLLSNRDVPLEGVHVVRRPYSLGDLIDMLRTAEPARPSRQPDPATAIDETPAAPGAYEQTTSAPKTPEPPTEPVPSPRPALFTSRRRPSAPSPEPVENEEPVAAEGPVEDEEPVAAEESVAGDIPVAAEVPVDEVQASATIAPVVVDEPEPEVVADAPAPSAGLGVSEPAVVDDEPAVDEPVVESPAPSLSPTRDAPQLDPIRSIEYFAQSLDAALAEAPFLMSRARFADGVAASVAVDFQLDHVALWDRVGDSMRVIGAHGLSDAERRLRPHERHPILQQARASEGVVVENADVGSALLLGMPGSRSVSYAVILLENSPLPVQMVTISGPDELPSDVIVRVETFIEETGTGWDAVAAVESITERLRNA